jgi:response regulator RpfG family c-di-GMP phosphodiesterase
VSYRSRAENALRDATNGSAAMILALVSLFGVFSFREGKSHATAGRLQQQNAQLLLHDSQLQVIQRLATAAEYRDDDTGQHTRRVSSPPHRSARSCACRKASSRSSSRLLRCMTWARSAFPTTSC